MRAALLVLGVVGVVALAAIVPAAEARGFRGDLTEPSGDAPFGGDVVGSYRISVGASRVSIDAWLELTPALGQTFEGWLVDPTTDYKLSLGALTAGGDDDDDDGSQRYRLDFRQRMVNPFTYAVLVITSEPSGDLNPLPDAPVAGALLPEPFGQ